MKGAWIIRLRSRETGLVTAERTCHNMITREGLERFVRRFYSVITDQTAAPDNFYVGLINFATFSAVAKLDTMGSHVGWEEAVAYDQPSRPLLVPSARNPGTGPASHNPQPYVECAPAVFTPSGPGALRAGGIFVCDEDTKGGTTGLLWSTAIDSVSSTPSTDIEVTYRLYFGRFAFF